MTIFDDFLNFIPGASLIQKAVRHEKVDATDFMPGSKLALTTVTKGASMFGKVAGNTLSKSVTTIGAVGSNFAGGLGSGLASGAPMTTAVARKSPQENVAYAPQQQEDNTTIYIAGGLGIVVVAGTVYMVLKK
jgi:hypothetical protein